MIVDITKQRQGQARGAKAKNSFPTLSSAEHKLLTLLAEKPLLSGKQITAIRTSSASWTMNQLKRLEKCGLLSTSVVPGQVDTFAHRHYYLADEGIRVLARRKGMAPGRFARTHWLSASRLTTLFNSLEHTRASRQFFIDLAIHAQQHTGDALDVWLDEAAASRRYLWRGEVKLLRPDGYGVYRRNAQAMPFFLEWDSGNSGIKRHRRKLRIYHEYRTTLGNQRFPAILAVTTRDRVRQLSRAALEVGRCCYNHDLHLLIAVNAELQSHGAFGCLWRDVRGQKTISLSYLVQLWDAKS